MPVCFVLIILSRASQGDNAIGPEGAGVLAGALEKLTGMQELRLVSCFGFLVQWLGVKIGA